MDIGKKINDSFKLLKHLDRLSSFEKEGFTYPILIDFDVSNRCNNNCPLCCRSKNIDDIVVGLDDAERVISQLREADVKAVCFGGGGDPSCNPNLEGIIKYVKEKGMESALYSNCYELSGSLIETIVNDCTWMRISLDADSPEIYKKTHGMGKEAFFQLIENIGKIVETRKRNKSEIVIGACYLLGNHTVKGVYNAAKLSKELGVDYIRFRPFFSIGDKKVFHDKEGAEEMFREFEKCRELEDKNFSISYPVDRCESELTNEKRERSFNVCYFPHFFASITADLNLYPCCSLKGNSKYFIGNLKEKSFKELWLSERRKNIHKEINLRECPNPCQFENNIKLLYAIKHPIFHSNFI